MQIIIDIPEEVYNRCKEYRLQCGEAEVLESAVARGISLPKEHGRLMILSKDKVKENQIDLDFSCQKWISEVDLSNATVANIEAESEG